MPAYLVLLSLCNLLIGTGAFSLNKSMLYLGTAGGAAIGGVTGAVVGFAALAWVGAPFAVLGGGNACRP